MKKLFLMLTATIVLTGIIFTGCKKNELTEKNDFQDNSAFSKKEIVELHKIFNFVSINSYLNKTENENFINKITSTDLYKNNYNKDYYELNYSKVTEIIWNDNVITSTIPYKNDNLKYFVSTSFNNDNSFDFILENFIDNNGNGEINIIEENNFISMTFTDGKLISFSSINKTQTYSECFENAENTMTEDGVGTIAWYTNPQIAIMVAIICSLNPNAF